MNSNYVFGRDPTYVRRMLGMVYDILLTGPRPETLLRSRLRAARNILCHA